MEVERNGHLGSGKASCQGSVLDGQYVMVPSPMKWWWEREHGSREEETLEGWNKKNDKASMTKKKRMEQSSETRASEEASAFKQSHRQVLFSLQIQIFKKSTVGFCLFGAFFLFCLCALERTREIQWLRWNPYVSRRDRTQINHLGSTYPQLRPSTEQAPSLVSRNPSQNQNCLANFAKWKLALTWFF